MYGLYVGCLGPIVTIAAYLIIGKPIFQREKPGARHGVMKTVADAREDLMLNEKHEIYTLLNAFGKWSNHSNPPIFSKENRLVRTDVYKKLEERRIIDGSDEMWAHYNRNGTNFAMIRMSQECIQTLDVTQFVDAKKYQLH